MLRGMPFVDIAFLRNCDLRGNVIVYRRKKTGAWLTVRVEAEAMKIIRNLRNTDKTSPYLFPLIHHPGKDEYRQYQNALRSFNYHLKRLGERIKGVAGLTSYTARHSWATIANYRNYQQELKVVLMSYRRFVFNEMSCADKEMPINRKIMQRLFFMLSIFIKI